MKKIITFIIILCMVIPLTSFSTQSSNQPAIQTISRDAIPEIVPYSQVEQAGHAKRLYSQENELNSVIFENTDGTNSLYMFSENVKYIDSDGKVKDKSNKLSTVNDEKSIYAYTNEQNDVKTFFPKQLSVENGIKLAYNNIEVNLYPDTDIMSTAKKESYADKDELEKDNIIYNNVFGENTAISYSCLFEGFKEDIILYKDIKRNTFSFILKTNGLTLKETDGLWLLYDKDEPVGRIDNLYVYDALGNTTFNNKIEVTELESGIYKLTLVIDETFLKDATYPVVIDPTITVNSGTNGPIKNIEDTTIFAGATSYVGGSLDKLYVGATGTLSGASRGTAYTFIRFPALAYDGVFNSLHQSQITACNLYLYESRGLDYSAEIQMFIYRGNTWSEGSLNYAGADITNISGSHGTIAINNSTAGWVEFPIHGMAQYWRSGEEAITKGLMLKNKNNTNTNLCKYFNSSEASINKPYLILTYRTQLFENGIYRLRNRNDPSNPTNPTKEYLTVFPDGYDFTLGTMGLTHDAGKYWYIEKKPNGYYKIASMFPKDYSTYGQTLYYLTANSDGTVTVKLEGTVDAIAQEWSITISDNALRITSARSMSSAVLTRNSSTSITHVQGSTMLWDLLPPYLAPLYFDRRYSNSITPGAPVHVRTLVDSGAFANSAWDDSDLNILDCWNGISSKVNVYTPEMDNPIGPYYAKFRIFEDDANQVENIDIQPGQYGIHIPQLTTSGGVTYWLESHIYLKRSGAKGYDNMQYLIIHEFGHALGLKHPQELLTGPSSANPMVIVKSDKAVLSVMNKGGCDNYDQTTKFPTPFDKYMIRQKWGD